MDAVVVAVAHEYLAKKTPEEIAALYAAANRTKILFDVKGIYDKQLYTAPEYDYWRL